MKDQDKKLTLIQLAVRERLMNFYKGTSTRDFVWAEGINLSPVQGPREYQYQRRLQELRQPSHLIVGSVQLAELYKNPGECKLLVDRTQCVPATQSLLESILAFFEEYLPAVKITFAEELKGTEVDVTSLVNVRLRQTDRPENPYVDLAASAYAQLRGVSLDELVFSGRRGGVAASYSSPNPYEWTTADSITVQRDDPAPTDGV